MTLKAYMAYDNYADWCLLVYAHTRNEARYTFVSRGPAQRDETDYATTSALRSPTYDKYATGDTAYTVDFNDQLPPGAPPFYGGLRLQMEG